MNWFLSFLLGGLLVSVLAFIAFLITRIIDNIDSEYFRYYILYMVIIGLIAITFGSYFLSRTLALFFFRKSSNSINSNVTGDSDYAASSYYEEGPFGMTGEALDLDSQIDSSDDDVQEINVECSETGRMPKIYTAPIARDCVANRRRFDTSLITIPTNPPRFIFSENPRSDVRGFREIDGLVTSKFVRENNRDTTYKSYQINRTGNVFAIPSNYSIYSTTGDGRCFWRAIQYIYTKKEDNWERLREYVINSRRIPVSEISGEIDIEVAQKVSIYLNIDVKILELSSISGSDYFVYDRSGNLATMSLNTIFQPYDDKYNLILLNGHYYVIVRTS